MTGVNTLFPLNMNRDTECRTLTKTSANNQLLSNTLKHKGSCQNEWLHHTFTKRYLRITAWKHSITTSQCEQKLPRRCIIGKTKNQVLPESEHTEINALVKQQCYLYHTCLHSEMLFPGLFCRHQKQTMKERQYERQKL